MIERNRVPASRPRQSPAPLARDSVDPLALGGPAWCESCETKTPRRLAALHRCLTCGRECCRLAATPTRREVEQTIATRSTMRVFEP